MSRKTFSALLNGKSGISPEMALRFSKVFGRTPEGWIPIKTVIIRKAILSAFSKNIKQLTFAGCQSEIPPNSS